jgi:dihydrofolate reductase
VFSRTPPAASPPGVEIVREPIDAFATRLRAMPGKDIWMMGGAGIIGSVLDEGEIDEFIIHATFLTVWCAPTTQSCDAVPSVSG